MEQLRTRIRQYGDYDEIKRELEIMKYVEFAGLDEDADEEDGTEEGYDTGANGVNGHVKLPDPNADKANAQRGKSLEALLALKNKRILEELTKFRVSSRHSFTLSVANLTRVLERLDFAFRT